MEAGEKKKKPASAGLVRKAESANRIAVDIDARRAKILKDITVSVGSCEKLTKEVNGIINDAVRSGVEPDDLSDLRKMVAALAQNKRGLLASANALSRCQGVSDYQLIVSDD